ncbi:hypothetical protein BCY84_03813 [Trypanosoma cruzi cruzi]|nr:hypothetical protein BCY84_11421 [Trypanosoma cruzi cruzi]PBJ78844.1 hypothetical protein BCY84_03813 [Trypanosoma cruzi cruzi]
MDAATKFLRERFAHLSMTKKEILIATVLVFLLYVSSIMMFFGMNFWLWSFKKGIKRSYATIFLPSTGWLFLFVVSTIVLRIISWKNGRNENFFFWYSRKGFILLLLIGLFDSLTGLLSLYSAVHVPVILQSALISTGPIWTYILAWILYPESQPKFSPILLLVVAFTAGGVTLAVMPQTQSQNKKKYFSPSWIVIFLIGTFLYPLYNVLQGRFLNEFRGSCSPFTSKIVMLTCETFLVFFFTLTYFPIDASPFFGKCDSLQESWDMFISSLNCVAGCPNNAIYMTVYILGFWIRHIVFAYMNGYSPVVAAVASQMTQPINTFILLIIPSWNVYGAKTVWYYTLGCFLLLLMSTIIFFVWHVLNCPPRRNELPLSLSPIMGSDTDKVDENEMFLFTEDNTQEREGEEIVPTQRHKTGS